MTPFPRRLQPAAWLAAATFVAAAIWLPRQALFSSSSSIPSSTVLAAPMAQGEVPEDHIVVGGQIKITDRDGDRQHPAAGVRVEVWDIDSGFPVPAELLDTTMTDSAGRFATKAIPNADRDGRPGEMDGTQDLFLRIYTDNGTVKLLEGASNRSFVWTSYEINEQTGRVNNVPDGRVTFPTQFIDTRAPDIQALWTYVDLAATWLFLRERTGTEPSGVTARWQAGSQDGPRIDPDTGELHLSDAAINFGHTVSQYAVYAMLPGLLDPLPAGWQACIEGLPSDFDPRRATSPECAMVHGLAVFLAVAGQGDLEYETAAVPGVDIDLATTGTPGWEDGDTVPGRVAGALWDLHEGDLTEDGVDRFNATFADIWEVVDQARPATLSEWWDGWKALGKDGCPAVSALAQNTIDYNLPPTVQPIPDVEIQEDETAIVDLNNYVYDTECGDEGLIFTMIDAGTPEAGVSLLPTNVISITPEADWAGETQVTLEVSDGLVASPISFRVIVRPINDCPVIPKRIRDPAPALFSQPIVLDLTDKAVDTEDAPTELTWDVEVPPEHNSDITVSGRGSRQLAFLLNRAIRDHYSAIVTLVVSDRDGCTARQAVALYWTSEGNTPPVIDSERLLRTYVAPVGQTIRVDLTDVARDEEDGRGPLEWFVINPDDVSAQVEKQGPQVLDFVPFDGFVGSTNVELEVQDTGAARTTAGITLTWKSLDDQSNFPPEILRQKLVGRTGAVNGEVCYELTDMAVDRDHNRFSLRWFAEPLDPDSLFVGPQGRRELCFRTRPDFEGCLVATFVVRDPRHAEDRYDVRTCWRTVDLYLPMTMLRR